MSKNNRFRININPNEIKSRDIIHMQEFINGVGGAHKNKRRDRIENRRRDRKAEKAGDYDD